MSTTSRRWSGSRVRRARAHWAPWIASGDAWCWRCGLPIAPGTRWVVGHLVDRALGGGDEIANTHPEHGRCSDSSGGRLAAEIRRAATSSSRSTSSGLDSDTMAERRSTRPSWIEP